jgi:hypothetical protein
MQLMIDEKLSFQAAPLAKTRLWTGRINSSARCASLLVFRTRSLTG